MLTNQRRCAPDIIDLVNRRFYDGLLTTDLTEKHLVASEPIFGNNHVEFLNISHLEEYQFGFTAGGSRFNDASREAVKTLLIEIYHKFKDIKSVGIISPYTAQISRIKKDILEIKKQITFPFEIKEGTIHTFQGSECDIIIFDMVESLKCIQKQESNIGALYRNETGERLINVALSRAISKLIIVECTKVLVEGKKEAQVRSSVKTIIKDAYNKSFMKN